VAYLKNFSGHLFAESEALATIGHDLGVPHALGPPFVRMP
jgi:hypothetical protein